MPQDPWLWRLVPTTILDSWLSPALAQLLRPSIVMEAGESQQAAIQLNRSLQGILCVDSRWTQKQFRFSSGGSTSVDEWVASRRIIY